MLHAAALSVFTTLLLFAMGMFREGCLVTFRMEMKGCGDSEILHGLVHDILYTN